MPLFYFRGALRFADSLFYLHSRCVHARPLRAILRQHLYHGRQVIILQAMPSGRPYTSNGGELNIISVV